MRRRNPLRLRLLTGKGLLAAYVLNGVRRMKWRKMTMVLERGDSVGLVASFEELYLPLEIGTDLFPTLIWLIEILAAP
jgi:hypothetical protein